MQIQFEKPIRISLTSDEFSKFQHLVAKWSGIHLPESKKQLVENRLHKRIIHYALNSFSSYARLLQSNENKAERQTFIDLITTNETYFFREDEHFEFLRKYIISNKLDFNGKFRLWSAASSSGEEGYSASMVISDNIGNIPWEVLFSDINLKVVHKAQTGVYEIVDSKKIPILYLKKFCLKGVRTETGKFIIDTDIKRHCLYSTINLNNYSEKLGKFHFIFLRNMLIYFTMKKKAEIIDRISNNLLDDGFLVVGKAENLVGLTNKIKRVTNGIYKL